MESGEYYRNMFVFAITSVLDVNRSVHILSCNSSRKDLSHLLHHAMCKSEKKTFKIKFLMIKGQQKIGFDFLAHLCKLHGRLMCIAFCLSVVQTDQKS